MKYDEIWWWNIWWTIRFGIWGSLNVTTEAILFMWGHRLQHCQRRFCDQHWRGSMHSWDQLSNSAGSGNTVIYITSIYLYHLISISLLVSCLWDDDITIYLIQGWWCQDCFSILFSHPASQDDTRWPTFCLQVVSGVLLIYGEIDTDFLSSGVSGESGDHWFSWPLNQHLCKRYTQYHLVS